MFQQLNITCWIIGKLLEIATAYICIHIHTHTCIYVNICNIVKVPFFQLQNELLTKHQHTYFHCMIFGLQDQPESITVCCAFCRLNAKLVQYFHRHEIHYCISPDPLNFSCDGINQKLHFAFIFATKMYPVNYLESSDIQLGDKCKTGCTRTREKHNPEPFKHTRNKLYLSSLSSLPLLHQLRAG